MKEKVRSSEGWGLHGSWAPFLLAFVLVGKGLAVRNGWFVG